MDAADSLQCAEMKLQDKYQLQEVHQNENSKPLKPQKAQIFPECHRLWSQEGFGGTSKVAFIILNPGELLFSPGLLKLFDYFCVYFFGNCSKQWPNKKK